ncbi:MAG: orotidine-5'-phosphate decarboxylase [Candidatus Omnitrophota bacterium]|jgi:orotidine-5'-phosphate decarboxylase
MNTKDRLIVALDLDNEEKAVAMAERLKNEIRFFKIGLELFSSCGPSIVKRIGETDCELFLDLKFHDIPNTVAKAARAVTRLGVYMFNVHALGGYEMMKAASEAAADEAKKSDIDRPKILAVTVLTSMDQKALKNVGVNANIKNQVLKLAKLAKSAGLDGVVASAKEAKAIRQALGEDFLVVTPGVRPAVSEVHDQKRIATPRKAIKDGASFIVVGRPITEARDPVEAARNILREIDI